MNVPENGVDNCNLSDFILVGSLDQCGGDAQGLDVKGVLSPDYSVRN